MKHLTGTRTYILFCIFAVIAMATFSAYSKKASWNEDANKRKASYLYIQAIEAFDEDKYNLYGQLITRAYKLDPNDLELRSRYGEWQLMINSNDSANVNNSFASIIDAYKSKPADYFEGMQLINLTSNYRRWNDYLTVAEIMHSQFPNRNEVTAQLGRSYLMQALRGDTSYIRPALDILTTLEDKLGKMPQLTELKVAAYSMAKDTAAIYQELNALNQAVPNDISVALTSARISENLNEPTLAKEYYDRACEIDSTNGNAIIMRAQFLKQQGDSTTFDIAAFKAIESRDLDLETKLRLTVDYVNMIDNDTTLQSRIDTLFDRLLDVNPGEADVHRLYGEYLSHVGNNARAAEQLQYTVALEPEKRSNWVLLAHLQAMTEDNIGAANTLQQVRNRFGLAPELIMAEASYLFNADSIDRSIEVLEATPDSIFEEVEGRSLFHTLKGDIYYQVGNKAKAFATYRVALDLNPLNCTAMNNVAYYYAVNDTLLDEALAYARRALKYEPDNVMLLDTYAWALYKSGHFEEAKDIIGRTIRLELLDEEMDSADIVIDKIIDSEIDGKDIEEFEKEIKDEEQALKGSADMFDHAGDIFFMNGDTVRAVKFWTGALKRKPENPDEIKRKIKERRVPPEKQPKKSEDEP